MPKRRVLRGSGAGLSLTGFIALASFWRRLYPRVHEALGMANSQFLMLCFAVSMLLVASVVLTRRVRRLDSADGEPRADS